MDKIDYLSPEEVGKMFRASKWTVRRWVEAGKLPAVRLGRRLLIPAAAVERMVEQQLSPSDLQERAHITHSIVRGPAPRYDYFELSMNSAEVSKLAFTIMSALRDGGWPYDTFDLKKEGVRRIILGEEKAPPAFWRYLCDGIERMQADAPTTDMSDELKSSKR